MPIYLQHGNLIDYVPPTDTSTEDVVFMGGLVGIPQAFIPAGELGALSVDGVYMFTKKDGVSVNLGEVVKYCGTTKLAQDSNADLTLGVAVDDAEADDYGVKVKINSVLPSSGGGGGDIEIDTSAGLTFGCGGLAVNIRDGLYFGTDGEVSVKIGSGLSFGSSGELTATGGGGGGGGGEVAVSCGLAFNDNGQLYVSTNCGLDFGGDGELYVKTARLGGIGSDAGGVFLKVCTASGLSIDNDGYLVYNG